MFGQKLQTAMALVAHYEALFSAIGFDPSQAKADDTSALKAFIDSQGGAASAAAADNSAAILAGLEDAGIELEAGASAEDVAAAVAHALTAAEATGGATATAAHLAALKAAGISVKKDADAAGITAAVEQKVAADVAAKIAANGHGEPLETPAGDTSTKTAAEYVQAIGAETDPVKKQALYEAYAEKYLPPLG